MQSYLRVKSAGGPTQHHSLRFKEKFHKREIERSDYSFLSTGLPSSLGKSQVFSVRFPAGLLQHHGAHPTYPPNRQAQPFQPLIHQSASKSHHTFEFLDKAVRRQTRQPRRNIEGSATSSIAMRRNLLGLSRFYKVHRHLLNNQN
jgi:hypothetical protein